MLSSLRSHLQQDIDLSSSTIFTNVVAQVAAVIVSAEVVSFKGHEEPVRHQQERDDDADCSLQTKRLRLHQWHRHCPTVAVGMIAGADGDQQSLSSMERPTTPPIAVCPKEAALTSPTRSPFRHRRIPRMPSRCRRAPHFVTGFPRVPSRRRRAPHFATGFPRVPSRIPDPWPKHLPCPWRLNTPPLRFESALCFSKYSFPINPPGFSKSHVKLKPHSSYLSELFML